MFDPKNCDAKPVLFFGRLAGLYLGACMFATISMPSRALLLILLGAIYGQRTKKRALGNPKARR